MAEDAWPVGCACNTSPKVVAGLSGGTVHFVQPNCNEDNCPALEQGRQALDMNTQQNNEQMNAASVDLMQDLTLLRL
jgi:hypothetical protein